MRWDVTAAPASSTAAAPAGSTAAAPASDTAAAPAGGSLVTVRISWQGATGIGGFFERTFAPRGITRIYSTELDNLARAVG